MPDIISSLASNACQCLQGDIDSALNNISQKANAGAAKLAEMITGPLNNPINAINNTVLNAQHALATGFESQLKGLMGGIVGGAVGALNSSCFLKPFADFFGQVNGIIGKLAGIIEGLDLSIPTLNLNFQIALHVNICGGADTFSGPLASIFGASGLSLSGAFPIAGAFAGMSFPSLDYAGKFKEMVGSVVNITSMEKMVDNVLDAVDSRISEVTGQISDGIDAVKNWGENAAKTVNGIVATVKDPSAALSSIAKSVVPPSAVAWGAKFAGLFGFGAPKVPGGDTPKKPRDVNYLTKKAVGEKINTLLQANAIINSPNAGMFQGVHDALFSGFHAGTDEELGAEIKKVLGMENSPVSNVDVARDIKKLAGDMSVEGMALAEQRTFSEAIRNLGSSDTALSDQIARTAAAEDRFSATASESRDLARSDRAIAHANVEIERSTTIINDALAQRVTQTPEERILTDQLIADERGFQVSQIANRTKLQAERDETARFAQDKGPLSNSDALSTAAGERPTSEPRFSSLVPVPGAGERLETVFTPPASTTVEGAGTGFAPHTEGESEAMRVAKDQVTKRQEIIATYENVLTNYREERAVSGTTSIEKLQIDKSIAETEIAKARQELQLLTDRNRVLHEETVDILNFTSNESRSQRLAAMIPDSRLAAAASSQPGTVPQNISSQQPGNDNSALARRAVGTLPTAGDARLAALVEQNTRTSADSARFEALVQPARPSSPKLESLVQTPGSSAALEARAKIPNSDEVFAARSIEVIEAREKKPPLWLAQFITTGLAPQ